MTSENIRTPYYFFTNNSTTSGNNSVAPSVASRMYFLIRYYPNGHFTAYSRGIPMSSITHLSECRIIRLSNGREVNLTSFFVRFQMIIREKIRILKWKSHPLRLRYREIHGRWPPLPRFR